MINPKSLVADYCRYQLQRYFNKNNAIIIQKILPFFCKYNQYWRRCQYIFKFIAKSMLPITPMSNIGTLNNAEIDPMAIFSPCQVKISFTSRFQMTFSLLFRAVGGQEAEAFRRGRLWTGSGHHQRVLRVVDGHALGPNSRARGQSDPAAENYRLDVLCVPEKTPEQMILWTLMVLSLA